MNQDAYRSEQAAPPGGLQQPQGAELRGAPRFTLLVRTAKLVIDGNEYLCVLRDASSTGCKVRLFHALPQGRSLALETSQGDRFPMDLVWYRDDHAGFRFHRDIDVHSLLDDNRGQYRKRQIRMRVEGEAMVHANGMSFPVVLRDISQQGACIESPERLMLRQSLRIEAAGFPPITAKVCWRQMPRHGLVFDRSFLLEELANNLVKFHESGHPGRSGMRAAS